LIIHIYYFLKLIYYFADVDPMANMYYSD